MAFRTRIVLATAVTAALLLPASAMAAGWADFTAVAPDPGGGRSDLGAKIASDPAGDQAAVWIEGGSPFKINVAYRPVGGAWGPAQTLDQSSTQPPSVDIASDAGGDFAVVYVTNAAAQTAAAAFLASGSTTFGTPASLAPVGGPTTGYSSPSVAFDGQGRAFAAYELAGVPPVAMVRSAGPSGTWGATGTFPANSGTGADITVSSNGEATIADINGGFIRYFRRAATGGNWSALGLAGASNASSPSIAVDSSGRTTTVFLIPITTTGIGAQTCPAGAAVTCSSTTTFGMLNALANASSPSFALDPSTSNAVASWTESTGSAIAVAQRTGFAATGGWGSPVQLGTGTVPAVTFDSTGATTALFKDASTPSRIDAAFAAAGSAFAASSSPITDPTVAWSNPRAAADGQGDVFGIWTGAGVQSAVWDAQSPAISAFNVSSGAVAGSPVTLTAAASDTWSGVGYAWDFGDGQVGSGASVSHTYATAGTYTARVTATDAAGNSTSQTQSVQVAAAPVPPPPPATLPPPVLGKFINVYVLKNPVFYKLPKQGKHGKFQRLIGQAQVPNGTVIDTTKGRVLIVIDNGHGGTDSAQFYDGIFEVNQPKSLKGLANIFLDGGGFKGCPKAPRDPHAQLSRKKASPHRSVRHLWGSGTGKFRTVGRFASATVRGTKWLTDDHCDGTLVRVAAGKVAVRDFVKQKTVLVRAHHKYFAAARKK